MKAETFLIMRGTGVCYYCKSGKMAVQVLKSFHDRELSVELNMGHENFINSPGK